MSTNISKITNKEVINICDGRKIGYITDLLIDICSGKICEIIVLSNICGLKAQKKTEIRVPWDKICKIGEDTILVDMSFLQDFNDRKEKRKR